MTGEIWKDIPDFPGYRISSHGRVLSCRRPPGGKKIGSIKLDSVWVERKPCRNGIRKPYMVLTLTTPLYPGKVFAFKMHRLVWELFNSPVPVGYSIDHVNGDVTDNRLDNLRLATNSQNHMNQKPRDGRKFKGIERRKDKYVARIKCRGERFNLGTFDTVYEAASAYNEAAKLLHGNYARLNCLEDG